MIYHGFRKWGEWRGDAEKECLGSGQAGQTYSEVRKMAKKDKNHDAMERLKWQTAKDLGLDDDLENPGEELTLREAGKIGGEMVKRLVKKGEEAMIEEREREP